MFFRKPSPVELHAAREFALTEVPSSIRSDVLKLLRVFAKQDHTQATRMYVIAMFAQLAQFKPITPLMGDESEWEHLPEADLWQNRRCNHVFRNADGTAYDLHGRVFRNADGSTYIDQRSRVDITFPYAPTIEYVQP